MAKRVKKVMVVSLGCAKNLVDTEVMCGSLAVGGYMLTNLAEEADIILINTCSFIADARKEAEEEVRDALVWRRKRKSRRLVVAGCLPQRDLQETREAFKGVDLFLGLDDVPHAAELFDTLYTAQADAPAVEAFGLPSYIYDSAAPRLQLTPQNYAYVKIAEGCDHGCTFCSIPGIRGRQRSRSIEDIITECRQLLDVGVVELNFIAQDTTRYGAELGDGTTLARLIEACEEQLKGDYWIRILYTHPRYFGDDLITAYKNCSHVVPYVDIPLQHISSPILKRMGRQIDEAETRMLMDRLRAEIPNVAVRTTFLVGFPGETDEDFALLKDFIADYEFDRLGVFAYSPEKGTAGMNITEGRVPQEVAEARRDELMDMQRAISLKHNETFIGQVATVLVEGIDAEGNFIGRTVHDAPEVDNLVAFSLAPGFQKKFLTGNMSVSPDEDFPENHTVCVEDCALAGFVDVEIQGASEYDLTGVAVG